MSDISLKRKGSDRWEQFTPDEARAQYLSGNYTIATGKPMLLRLNTGELVRMDPGHENFDKVMAEGGRFATSEDYQIAKEADLEQKYGDRPLTATAMGLAKGAMPIGGEELVSGIAELAGDPQAAHEIPKRHRGLSLGSEIGGALLPGTVTAKAGLAVSRKLLGKGLSKATARALGMSTAAAGEGFAYGVGDVASENSLGNKKLTGEQAASHIGLMTVLGGILGGSTELAGPALRKLGKSRRKLRLPKRPSKDAVKRQIQRADGLDIPDAMAEDIAKASATAPPKTAKDPKLFDILFRKPVMRSVRRGEQIVKKGDAEFPELLNKALESGDAMDAYRKLSFKSKQFAKDMPKNNYDDAVAAARLIAHNMEEAAENTITLSGRATYKKIAKQLLKELDDTADTRRIQDVFSAMDRTKHRFDDVTRSFWKKSERPFGAAPQIDEEQFVFAHRGAMKKHLVDDNLYGLAGKKQAELTAVQADYLTSHYDFAKQTLKRNPDGTWSVAPEGMERFMKGLGSTAKDRQEAFLRAELTKRKALNKVMLEMYDVPDDVIRKVRESESAMDQVVKVLDANKEDLHNFHVYRELSRKYGSMSNVAAAVLGGAVGGAAFGVPGAVVGTLSRAGVFRGNAIDNAFRAMTILDDLTVGATGKTAKALNRWIVGPTKTGAARAARVANKDRAQRLALATFPAISEAVMAANTDPEQTTSRIQEAMPELAHAPETTAHVTETVTSAVEYLKTVMPAEIMEAYMTPRTLGSRRASRKPPEYVQRKFLRITEVLQDPNIIVDRLDEGSLTRDEVQAVKTVYPETYQALMDTVVETLVDMEEAGKELPYQKLIQLSVLMDAPLDNTMSPEFITTLTQTQAPMPAPASATQGEAKIKPTSDVDKTYRPGSYAGLDQYERK